MATARKDDHLAAQWLEANGTIFFQSWLRNPAVAQQHQQPQGSGPMIQPGPYAVPVFKTAQMSNAGAEHAAPVNAQVPPAGAAGAAPALPETVHDDGL